MTWGAGVTPDRQASSLASVPHTPTHLVHEQPVAVAMLLQARSSAQASGPSTHNKDANLYTRVWHVAAVSGRVRGAQGCEQQQMRHSLARLQRYTCYCCMRLTRRTCPCCAPTLHITVVSPHVWLFKGCVCGAGSDWPGDAICARCRQLSIARGSNRRDVIPYWHIDSR
jgi:hypothetical protein